MVAEPTMTTKPRTPSQICWRDSAAHEHHDADDEDHGGSDGAHARHAFQGAPTQRRDELGILLGKRLLHLLQQTEFLFGERHDFLPQ